MYNEFLEVVKNNKVNFFFYLYDLLIDVEISGIEADTDYCKLLIPGGKITIWKSNEIIKCIKPDNLIMECKHCFRLYSQYGDCIGYIYV